MQIMLAKLRISTEQALRTRNPKPCTVASLPTPSMVRFIGVVPFFPFTCKPSAEEPTLSKSPFLMVPMIRTQIGRVSVPFSNLARISWIPVISVSFLSTMMLHLMVLALAAVR